MFTSCQTLHNLQLATNCNNKKHHNNSITIIFLSWDVSTCPEVSPTCWRAMCLHGWIHFVLVNVYYPLCQCSNSCQCSNLFWPSGSQTNEQFTGFSTECWETCVGSPFSLPQYSGNILYCTVLYCAVLYCIILYSPYSDSREVYYIILYCNVHIVLYCTVLYYAVLYCTAGSKGLITRSSVTLVHSPEAYPSLSRVITNLLTFHTSVFRLTCRPSTKVSSRNVL